MSQNFQNNLGEVDEIFQGRHPCLTVVDGRTFAVLQLSPQKSRDADTRGVSFLQLQERGIQFADVALDGARGIWCKTSWIDCSITT
jgi:hypothetical protein